MYTREMARLIGLELHEQAQLSMAVSALADWLKMAPAVLPVVQPKTMNQISIHVADFGRHRLVVDFESEYVDTCMSIEKELTRIQGMVDDVQAEQLADGSMRVSMTKWSR
jgi:hypothetical protein